jgi:hypothetical protein
MPRRHFAVSEIEAMIPELETAFSRILQLRAGMRAFEQKLEAAGVDIDLDHDGEADGENPEVAELRAMFRGYYEALSESLEGIRSLGGDVKDLDLALVDFPARRGDQDVLLCWRLGEKRIQFWHTAEEGFAGRRPIDSGMAQTPQRLD